MTTHRMAGEGGGGAPRKQPPARKNPPADAAPETLAEARPVADEISRTVIRGEDALDTLRANTAEAKRVADAAVAIEKDTTAIAVDVHSLASSAQSLVTASGNLEKATGNIAVTLERLPGIASTERSATLRRAALENDEMSPLWMAINLHTEAISFPNYDAFMTRVLCRGGADEDDPRTDDSLQAQLARLRRLCHLPGVDVYDLLKTATETFLLLECGICPDERERGRGQIALGTSAGPDTALPRSVDRLSTGTTLTVREAGERLSAFLGVRQNNYLQTVILQNAFPTGRVQASSPFCDDDILLDRPCLLELIWSYWMEEGMLTQTVAAITRRFQNVRRPGRAPDPLAELELDPLRPMNGFLWGYLQDEPTRLSVARRAYEYSHHYGLTLYGRAVPPLRPADPRSRFLEAFHNLLRQAAVFYREDADTTVIADAFPVLNSLKELHLVLSEGAHNQFRDLPWTSRVEMLMQQWLLARPEMREFLRGRYMVAYPERWMGAVDSMKKLQGWTDTSVLHFRDLARFGERILLSVRYGNWSAINNQAQAQAWLRYWKEEIQGYVHAYHTATGVNLSDDVVEVRDRADIRYLQPSWHLRNRLLATRRAVREPR